MWFVSLYSSEKQAGEENIVAASLISSCTIKTLLLIQMVLILNTPNLDMNKHTHFKKSDFDVWCFLQLFLLMYNCPPTLSLCFPVT